MAFPKKPVIRFVKYVLGVFELLLGLRLFLRLLGANPSTPIVDFLYVLTDIIITPFQEIFSNVYFDGGGVFDVVAITAMLGYPVIVYLVLELVHLISKDKGEKEHESVDDIEIEEEH